MMVLPAQERAESDGLTGCEEDLKVSLSTVRLRDRPQRKTRADPGEHASRRKGLFVISLLGERTSGRLSSGRLVVIAPPACVCCVALPRGLRPMLALCVAFLAAELRAFLLSRGAERASTPLWSCTDT